MSKKLKVAMVSYINALPFKFGIDEKMENQTDLLEANPAVCAELFFNDKVDIALLPVGSLIDVGLENVFSDFCIGSIGEVQTVCLFSNTAIDEIKKVYLDQHSRTSVLLVQLLLKEHCEQEIEFVFGDTEELGIDKGEAKLMIGDKVFRNKLAYSNVIDLSKWWEEMTGLPFVFAVWVKKKDVNEKSINLLNNAFEYGVSHKKALLAKLDSKVDLKYYFENNISYLFDDKKKEALKLFFKKLDKNQIK